MKRKLLSAAVGGSALLLVLTACSAPAETDSAAGGGLTGTGSGAECVIDSAVPIAASFSLTGAAAQYGEGQKNALELAVKNLNEVGGVTYDLTVEDDATDPKQAIQVFDTFISAGASVIIGPTLSNTAKQTDRSRKTPEFLCSVCQTLPPASPKSVTTFSAIPSPRMPLFRRPSRRLLTSLA
ncbi:ABC transporter substrate-binding protein [Salinibacterium sp. PAMC 21357]|uniref:ABC transporter substrate-binding protein n=1 Tax=Salinibacterium sp. PAMC 21357 TaxID=1112215 RepID=UPI0002F0B4A5|nr:ABC transporter substrate-binding protein [Salinibacterium sp. PAMC 21357]